jgi:hypothetical protein
MRQKSKNGKTFIVSAMIGNFAGTPWPFGRFEIYDDAITVRTILNERTCLKSEITNISLERFRMAYQLLFEDETGRMANVAVGLTMRVKGVVSELQRRGYPVVDRRGSIFLPQGVVPWRQQDNVEGDKPSRS